MMIVMQQERTIRLLFFLGTLLGVALWELAAPCRPLRDKKTHRWRVNLSLVILNTGAVRYLLPILPVGMALTVQEHSGGLLRTVALPGWLTLILAVLLLDLAIYLQHLLFHFLPTLWLLHRVHHCDPDIDVTTGNRFHPLEILISAGIKLTAVSLIGPPVMAVILFELVLNASAQFNHGNIRVPDAMDRWLRLFIVTPNMHRIHHSIITRETNSNFGFNLPWWDRLLGTYRAEPDRGQLGMEIGLKEYDDPGKLTLVALLIQPFGRTSLKGSLLTSEDGRQELRPHKNNPNQRQSP